LRWIIPEWVWPEYVVLDGVQIRIRNTPYSFATKRILVNGEYEAGERTLLKGKIIPGDTIIEMGGSIGILTAILSRLTGKSGRVISIEASQRIGDYSRSWLKEKGNVEVVTGFGFPVYALEKSMRINGLDESAGSLGGVVSYSLEDHQSISQDQNVYDIRKIMTLYNIQPTVLVIDVEGSEKTILENDPGLPESVRLVLMELHPHFYGMDSMEKIINTLTRSGFELMEKQDHVCLFERSHSERIPLT
jgi:FkbM family methyltransferase